MLLCPLRNDPLHPQLEGHGKGTRIKELKRDNKFGLGCKDCLLQTEDWYDSKEEAIEAWEKFSKYSTIKEYVER